MSKTQIIQKYLGTDKNVIEQGRYLLYEVSQIDISDTCTLLYHTHHLPLKIAFAMEDKTGFKICYVFSIPDTEYFLVPFIYTGSDHTFPSITNKIHELAWYEREIYTFFGLKPEGYPKLQPIILQDHWPTHFYPLRKEVQWNANPRLTEFTYPFEKIEGEGIYEIPVGPVHAGIIEPGHFRFSVAGEEIVSLEARLGYVHKGSEKLFETLPLEQKVRLSERISGDSSFNHSLAFSQAVEELADIQVPKRAQFLRTMYAELERLANHFNDFGFIMMDTAYTFGGSQGSRLREMVMQINEQLTGSRFLRGVNTVGGVTIDIDDHIQQELLQKLQELETDYREVLEISQDSTSMINRLKGSGVLDPEIAKDHGVVGIVARAIGINIDTRHDHPYAAYNDVYFRIPTERSGDVYARFQVRVEEIFQSFRILQQVLKKLPKGPIKSQEKVSLHKNAFALGQTEGWRGEIVYAITTDENSLITRVAVRDPSFLNWAAIRYAVESNVVPDFPLINKSFNLSYSGNDK